jgi:hypothetical protein
MLTRILSQRPIVLGIAAAGASAAFAGAALSQAPVHGSPDVPPSVAKPQVATVDQGLAERFGVLRRPLRDDDAVPASVADLIGRGPTTLQGANLDLARKAMATSQVTVYAVPGNGQVCLVMVRGAAGFGTSCGGADAARGFGLVTTQAAAPGSTDRLVQALIPDGFDTARFRTDSGDVIEAKVTGENALVARVPLNTAEVELSGPAGSTKQPIVRPAG